MKRPEWLRLPVSRARHDKELDRYHALLVASYDLVQHEYDRAMADGKARVHAFMRDANAGVFRHPRPEAAIRAVFQQAEREFRPEPLTIPEQLQGPANIEEAIASA